MTKEELEQKLAERRYEEKARCESILERLDIMCEVAGCTRTEAAIMILSGSVSALTETVYDIFEQMENVNANLENISHTN